MIANIIKTMQKCLDEDLYNCFTLKIQLLEVVAFGVDLNKDRLLIFTRIDKIFSPYNVQC